MKNFFNVLFYSVASVLLVSCGDSPQPQVNAKVQKSPIADPAEIINIDKGRDKPISSKPCTFNVYVENSKSIDGYVKGDTEFEQSVYSYLSDINISDICESMNLFYINSESIKWQDDVKDFIEKLDPYEFTIRGGKRETTDISNLLDSILNKQGKDTVSIVISDFVFSPGSGKNAAEYLTSQQIGIKRHFALKLKKNSDMSFMIYRLTSNFEGKYYDRNNKPYIINHQRPFYIMLIGDQAQLKNLINKVPYKDIKGGVKNTYSLSENAGKTPYGILMMPKIGSFKPSPQSPMFGIIKAKVDKNNPNTRFLLAIGVDYSNSILGDDYLCDPANYHVSNKAFDIEIEKAQKGRYTHVIKLSLKPQILQVPKCKVSIKLKKQKSIWAEQFTNPDDVDNITEDLTYGLKYLIDGVYEAYSSNPIYSTFNINIQ